MKSESVSTESRRLELEAFAAHYGLRFLPNLLHEHVPAELIRAEAGSPIPMPGTDPTPPSNSGARISPEQEGGVRRLHAEVSLLHRFAGMWPFREGFLRHVKDLVFGSYSGLDWTIFDYGYGQCTDATPDTYGVVCARIPMNLPYLHLSPESFLHRLECCLGAHVLSLECQEFNERYFVRADDAREAFDILHPKALDYLLGLPPRDWQMRGCQVVLAQKAKFGIGDLPKVMGEIDGFVRLIPGYVREDRGVVPDWKGPFG